MNLKGLRKRICKSLSDNRASLELTDRAEQEYDRIMAELKQMTLEERKKYFQSMKQEPVRFLKKIDGATYIVRTFFQSEGNETLLDRAENYVVRNL